MTKRPMELTRMNDLRAFVCHETHLDVRGFCFAESAGKARMIAARSAWDAGFPAKITTITVRREPTLDGRVPAKYRNEFFSMEHAQYLLTNPNPLNERRDG